MWIVRIRGADRQEREEVVPQLAGEPVTVGVLRRLLDDAASRYGPVPEVVFQSLQDNYSFDGGIPGLTAIETWGFAAADLYEPTGSRTLLGRLVSTGPTIQWWAANRKHLAAWHDMTAVVIAWTRGDREIEIEYDPEESDQARASAVQDELGGSSRSLLDWRLHVGRNTAVIDGETPFRRFRNRLRARIRLGERVGDAEGVLIAKAHNQLGPRNLQLPRDPSWSARLADSERRFPSLAAQYPMLGGHNALTDPTSAVFVHGTRSCGLRSLADIATCVDRDLQIRRYEHDTFVPLIDNAEELVALVTATVSSDRLVLIAHSRGGLVARLAYDLLKRGDWTGDVRVLTFGTPHQGTPLVGRSLDVIAKVHAAGRLFKMDVPTDEYGVPVEDPVSAALALLFTDSAIPPGIAAMAENSEVCRMIPAHTTDAAYGGAFDFGSRSAGYGVSPKAARERRLAHDVFGSEENDLVVGLRSSTSADGGIRLTDPCGHSEYFRDQSVRRALSALSPSAAV